MSVQRLVFTWVKKIDSTHVCRWIKVGIVPVSTASVSKTTVIAFLLLSPRIWGAFRCLYKS